MQTDYMHSDHLGSMDAVTDDTGNIATDPVTGEPQVMSFDVFGLRRDPTNWSYDLTSSQIGGLKAKTDRGYTYQEQIDNVGLVHMNGRVYDPSVGRFISADPIQALNRYSYVGNNPLRYTDPSGYCFAGCFWQPSTQANAVSNLASGTLNTAGHIVNTAFNHLPEIAAVVVAYFTYDWAYATEGWGAAGAGAAAGGAYGGTDTALNGGSVRQVIDATGRGAAVGGVAGGLYGFAGDYASLETQGLGFDDYAPTFADYAAAYGGYMVAGGLTSKAAGGNFAEGAEIGVASYGLYNLYEYATSEFPQWEGGDGGVVYKPAGPSAYNSQYYDTFGAANVPPPGEDYLWGTPVPPQSFFCLNEGCGLMQVLDAGPGGNAVSTIHDVWAGYATASWFGGNSTLYYLTLDVPSMLPAAVITYGGLASTPLGAAILASKEANSGGP